MVYRFGDYTLDPRRHRLQRAGQPVRLRPKAFQILQYLLEHRDRTVLKQELYEHVWPQAFVSEATLESTVRAVRRAVGDSGRAQELIQTVYGYGYRFVAPVELWADTPPGPPDDSASFLAGTASPPPPDDALGTIHLPRRPEAAGVDDPPHALRPVAEERHSARTEAAELHREPPAVPPSQWEQKQVAVLAVEFTFPAGPETWGVASHWEQALMAQVQGAGGVVLQRSPSLLLVAFGIPRTPEQLPQRAVQAALALRRLVAAAADREGRPVLRVAGHWGPLLVDVQAGDAPPSLRATGETLAWPVRLLGQAAPGEILLSPALGRLVDGWCAVRVRRVPRRGGQPGSVAVHAVVGDRLHQPRLGRRPLTPFVGRALELAMLRGRLRRVEGGRGQVVGVVGEPGVGKSRLCDEFLRSVRVRAWRTLAAQGTAAGQATPFLPITHLLQRYFRVDDHDDRETIRDRVTAHLRGLDDTLTDAAPALLTLLEVPVDDPPWRALDARQRRQRTLDAFKRVFVRESQGRPVLLVVEDLHWVDAETQAFLDALVDSLPSARLLLVVTYRPEYRHDWGHKPVYTPLRLDPLSPAGVDTLLRSLLGDDPSLAPLTPFLIARTEGNPFFVEESVRTLAEAGVLAGERGRYRLAQTSPTIEVPATAQAVLAARIDRLSPGEKRLLQTAAVIGKDLSLPLLQAIVQRPEGELHRDLTHLQREEFLYETSLFPEPLYTFKHALTQEVAYNSLLQGRRSRLHTRIVGAIERLYSGQLSDRVDQLARHAFRGEVWDKALAYGCQAGEKAMARSAHHEATGYFERALGALSHLQEQHDMREKAIDLLLALRSALLPSGDLGRVLTLLREAEALALSLDDPRRLEQVLRFLSIHFRFMGAYDQAIIAAKRALALATAGGDVVRQALANRFLGDAYQVQGDYRGAIDCYMQTLTPVEGGRSRERFGQVIPPAVRSRAKLVTCHAELGTFAEGFVLGAEGLRLAEAMGHPASLMFASLAIGKLFLGRGDLPEALPQLERAIGITQQIDLPLYFPSIAAALGAAYARDGRIDDSVRLLTQALERASILGKGDNQTVCHLRLGEVQLQAGRREAAQSLADRALTFARTHQERGNEAYALRLLGDIAARRHRPEVSRAEDFYCRALALAGKLGMRPLQAHCHHDLGTLYAKSGQREQSRAELAIAIDLYRTMDMTFWLPQAEAARAYSNPTK